MDRVFAAFKAGDAHGVQTLLDLSLVAGLDHAGQIPLDVCDDAGHADFGQALSDDLQGDCLAGAAGAGDQSVPVHLIRIQIDFLVARFSKQDIAVLDHMQLLPPSCANVTGCSIRRPGGCSVHSSSLCRIRIPCGCGIHSSSAAAQRPGSCRRSRRRVRGRRLCPSASPR